MPWNGSGQFNRDTGVFTGATVWDDSRVVGRTVRTDDHDTHDEDIATGLENTVTRDGQNAALANLPMGGFRHTGVDDAVARDDYATAGQIQDQGLTHLAAASVGGTGDAITLSPTPAITAYAAGQRFSFIAEANNTGAVTVNISTVGAENIQKIGDALGVGDLLTGDLVIIEYDGTDFQMLLPDRPGKQTIFVPAAAMRPTVTNGCAFLVDVETSTVTSNIAVLDFDATSDEHAQFAVAFPKSWNAGTVSFKVFWTVDASVTTGVAWALQGVSTGDNVGFNIAYGTAQVVTDDAQSGVHECYITDESNPVTLSGTPADNEIATFRIFRDVSDANDDMTQDARLIGVQLFYIVSARSDN